MTIIAKPAIMLAGFKFMINDVLEQVAEDYFRHLGYFTRHNVKYKPNKPGPAFAVNSDVDIVGIHPNKKGIDRVVVASCKAWHGGLQIVRHLASMHKLKVKKKFREATLPIWSKALKDKVRDITGRQNFVLYFVCVKYKEADRKSWEEYKFFKRNLSGCEIKILDMKTMIQEVWEESKSITPAHSEFPRILQLINHSKGKILYKS